MILKIDNHGPLITRSNYWDSEYAKNGKIIISPNAGAIRCLIPPTLYPVLGELRQSEYALFSVGETEVEIIWEDHTAAPHTWVLSKNACLMVPGDPGDQRWVISCWVSRRGQPHRSLERPCYWRKILEKNK